jgi:hypothetical protein
MSRHGRRQRRWPPSSSSGSQSTGPGETRGWCRDCRVSTKSGPPLKKSGGPEDGPTCRRLVAGLAFTGRPANPCYLAKGCPPTLGLY